MPGVGSFVSQSIKYGFDAFQAHGTYVDQREKNHGVAYSAGAAALSLGAWAVIPEVMWGLTAFDIAKTGMQALTPAIRQASINQSRGYQANFGGNYVDTQQAYTMRQRGLQAIQNSNMNVRSTLGSEARQYVRNNMYL